MKGKDAGQIGYERVQASYLTTASQLAVAHSVLLALHHFLGKPFSFNMEEPKENLTGRKRTERGTGNHDHASMASRNRDFIKVAEVDLEKHLSTRALQQLSYVHIGSDSHSAGGGSGMSRSGGRVAGHRSNQYRWLSQC